MYKSNFLITSLIVSTFLFVNNSLVPLVSVGNPIKVTKTIEKGMNSIFQEFLPSGAKIIVAKKIDTGKPFMKFDLYEDKNEETLVFYEIDETYEKGFVVLKSIDGKLIKIFGDKNKSGRITKVDFINIYPGLHKSLIVGYFGSDLAGSEYKVYTFTNDGVNVLNLSGYNRMDILNTTDIKNGNGFVFGGWNRIGPPELYVINVIRFDGKNFTLAYDFYEDYFKSVVKYFEDKAVYNYPLIDAMIKANMNDKALKLIDKGLDEINEEQHLSYIYDKWDYYLLRARALNGLKRCNEAKNLLIDLLNNKDAKKDDFENSRNLYISDVYFELGVTYKLLNDNDKSKENFEKSLDILKGLDKKGYFNSIISPNIDKEIKFYPVEYELKSFISK